jgi:hypothetical protein
MDVKMNIPSGPAVCLMSFDYFKRCNPLHISNRDTYETEICIMYDSLTFHFDYLWFIENDVVCNGDWKETLDKCNGITTDFLATSVASIHQEPNWAGWGYTFWAYDVPYAERWKAFVPISRHSRKLIELYRENLGKISCYCESYFATLCARSGMSMDNFPTDMIGSYYTWFFQDPDAVKFFEDICAAHPNEHRLYHPIKST